MLGLGLNLHARPQRRASPLAALYPGHVWAADFTQQIASANGVAVPFAAQFSTLRASDKYVTNADGTLSLKVPNQPPLSDRGLDIEGSAENILPYSQDFGNAAWSKQNVTVTNNYALAPDGTMTATRLEITDPNVGGIQAFNLLDPENAATTLYVKLNSGSPTPLTLFSGAGGNVQNHMITNEWQRASYINGSPINIDTRFFKRDAWGSAGIADLLIWQADTVDSPFISSPIYTNGGSAVRAADHVDINYNFASQNEFTLLLKGVMLKGLPSSAAYIFDNSVGSAGVAVLVSPSGDLQFQARRNGENTERLVSIANAVSANTKYNIAVSAGPGGQNIAINGVAGTRDATAITSITDPGIDYIALGRDVSQDDEFLNGLIEEVVIFPNETASDTVLEVLASGP